MRCTTSAHALPRCRTLAATSSLALATACSVGLPDNVDEYLSSRGKLVATVTDAGGAPMSAVAAACTPSFEADAAVSIIEVWRPPVALHQNVCSEEQMALVINCSFTDPMHATPACQRLFSMPENAACLKCAVSSRSDVSWGALLHDSVSEPPYPNVEGCVAALSGDTSQNGCGAKMIADQDCSSYACRNCDTTRGSDYEACYQAASQGSAPQRIRRLRARARSSTRAPRSKRPPSGSSACA
ncbi:MAG: hypothetical protein U0235_23205 [Polyangiaceae bacterium]